MHWLLILDLEHEVTADPQVFEVRPQYFSTCGLLSQPGDEVPNTAFLGLLEEPEIEFGGSPEDLGSSGGGIGSFVILNPLSRQGDSRPCDSWRNLYFRGRSWRAYSTLSPRPQSMAEFALVARGSIEKIRWEDGERQVVVETREELQNLDVDLNIPRYLGLGDVLRFETADQVDLGIVPLPAEWTWMTRVRYHAGDLAGANQLIIKADALNDGYRLVLNWQGNGGIRLWALEYSPQYVETASGILQEDGLWRSIAITGGDGHLRIYVDGELAAEAAVTGSPTAPDRPLTFGPNLQCDATGWYLQATVIPSDGIRALASQQPDPRHPDAVGLWRGIAPPDGLPNSVKDLHHGTRTGTTERYGGEGWYSDSGIPRPVTVGEVFGVPGHQADPTRWLFDFHYRPISQVVEGLHRGQAMGEGENYEVDLAAGSATITELVGSVGEVRWHLVGEDDGAGPLSSLPEIVKWIIIELGPRAPSGAPRYSEADFGDAFDPGGYPLEHMALGLHLEAGTTGRALALAQSLCEPLDTRLEVDLLGRFQLVYLGPPTSDPSTLPDLREDIHYGTISEEWELSDPTTEQVVQYAKNYGVQSDADLSPSAGSERRSFATSEWRVARWAAPAGQEGRIGGAAGEPVATALVTLTDAQELAQRRQGGYWGAEGRHMVRVELLQPVVIEQGAEVALYGERVINATEGRAYRVGHYSSGGEFGFGTLELWGLRP